MNGWYYLKYIHSYLLLFLKVLNLKDKQVNELSLNSLTNKQIQAKH
jgi:hypothetical protein